MEKLFVTISRVHPARGRRRGPHNTLSGTNDGKFLFSTFLIDAYYFQKAGDNLVECGLSGQQLLRKLVSYFSHLLRCNLRIIFYFCVIIIYINSIKLKAIGKKLAFD